MVLDFIMVLAVQVIVLVHILTVLIFFSTVTPAPLRLYSKGFNRRRLPAGGWTRWFNQDHSGRSGDYETTILIRREYGTGCDGLPCRRPIAIKVMSAYGLTPSQEGDRVYISPSQGFYCVNHHQNDGKCADYRVRFYCPGMQYCHKRKWTNGDVTRNRMEENDVIGIKQYETGRHGTNSIKNRYYTRKYDMEHTKTNTIAGGKLQKHNEIIVGGKQHDKLINLKIKAAYKDQNTATPLTSNNQKNLSGKPLIGKGGIASIGRARQDNEEPRDVNQK